MRFSISQLSILAIAALFTSAAAVDIEARQTPAPPVTPVPTPTSTVKSTLDPSQSASRSMAIQSALASYASYLSAASASALAAGSTLPPLPSYTLASPGASAAAKAAEDTSGSERSMDITWTKLGLGMVKHENLDFWNDTRAWPRRNGDSIYLDLGFLGPCQGDMGRLKKSNFRSVIPEAPKNRGTSIFKFRLLH
ncbi:hypothetical protein EYC80_009512 [Monilinia laxa]|uniref:Uncharacterized protein n=1 Tax=Monilinia laxa TaxID=61186 RepID=A0A5N6JYC8_MONLA|nr:hypothetical protein EYC80_009512 [Monilinia laxa]